MSMKRYRTRWRNPLLVCVSAVFVVTYFTLFRFPAKGTCNLEHFPEKPISKLQLESTLIDVPVYITRHLLEDVSNATNELAKNSTNHPQAQFPNDLFTAEQRRQGAVALHVFGLVYMFVALAIVCDEFFVPSLDVITNKLGISDDVAGATFMAAGGSAPELFTSVIGVFISYDDVGIGTIVGSAVFNILFVISMCAIFSKNVLSLTWWPLFRDVTFYSASLITLIICFMDNVIEWYEATILLGCYIAYVTFMKFNEVTERAVKSCLNRSKNTRVGSKDHLITNMKKRRASTPILHAGSKFRHGLLQLMIHSIDPLHDGKLDEKASQLHAIASLRVLLDAAKANGGYPSGPPPPVAPPIAACCASCATCPTCVTCPTCNRPLRNAATASPMPQARPDIAAATPMNSYSMEASGSFPQDATIHPLNPPGRQAVPKGLDPLTNFQNIQTSSLVSSLANGTAERPYVKEQPEGVTRRGDAGHTRSQSMKNATNGQRVPATGAISTIMTDSPAISIIQTGSGVPNNATSDVQHTMVEGVAVLQPKPPEREIEVEEPLDISWPTTNKKRMTYVLMAPIIFPLWLTLPDVRRDEKKKWFFVTFLGSILWIAIFSYLMVWWGSVVGETIGIPNEVMGLTFLAAGTSIPDLITSVLVARKGLGDMAVSSSIGSNIFDVTVGLPLPWLLSSLMFGPVHVSSSGMACSIVILFFMLLFVIISIAAFKWRMNVGLAMVMFLLYFVFVAVSLLLEYEIINCSYIMEYVTGK